MRKHTKNPHILYFLPIIAKALQQKDQQQALQQAFSHIDKLAAQPQYGKGYKQFLRFMSAVDGTHQKNARLIQEFAWELSNNPASTKTLEIKKLLHAIKERRHLHSIFKEATKAFSKSKAISPSATLIIEKNGSALTKILLQPGQVKKTIRQVTPGLFRAKLSTGWIIWQEQLTPQDLIWSQAFPERGLKLAAASDDVEEENFRQIILLDGALSIKIFPEIESGRLEITAEGICFELS